METITTDVIIQGPATCGRTGETYYEAWLPLRSPAQEYIKGTPCASGPTPYAAMVNLASKYPWAKDGGPLVTLSFAGPVADKVILDYHTCPDCGKDEREDERHGGHYFVCEADPANAETETETCSDCGGGALRLDTTTGAVDCVDCGGE